MKTGGLRSSIVFLPCFMDNLRNSVRVTHLYFFFFFGRAWESNCTHRSYPVPTELHLRCKKMHFNYSMAERVSWLHGGIFIIITDTISMLRYSFGKTHGTLWLLYFIPLQDGLDLLRTLYCLCKLILYSLQLKWAIKK